MLGRLHLKGNFGLYNPTAGESIVEPLYIFGCNPILTSRFALLPKAGKDFFSCGIKQLQFHLHAQRQIL